jgi:hypothetical protein
MKKLLVVFSLLFLSFNANSQVLITLLLGDKLNSDGLEFGLEGGLNWTQISNMESSNMARKWNLGFYFDFRLKNQWFLYTGVLVKSNMGLDKLTDYDLNTIGAKIYYHNDGTRIEGDYSQKMNYFLVPALIKYKFKNHMYLELGPQFGLMYKSWVEFEADVDGSDAIFKEYNREKINKLDAGIMIGLGYTTLRGKGWTLGVKYYYGFVDVYKDHSGTKNSSFFVKLNIPIGRQKAKMEVVNELKDEHESKKE